MFKIIQCINRAERPQFVPLLQVFSCSPVSIVVGSLVLSNVRPMMIIHLAGLNDILIILTMGSILSQVVNSTVDYTHTHTNGKSVMLRCDRVDICIHFDKTIATLFVMPNVESMRLDSVSHSFRSLNAENHGDARSVPCLLRWLPFAEPISYDITVQRDTRFKANSMIITNTRIQTSYNRAFSSLVYNELFCCFISLFLSVSFHHLSLFLSRSLHSFHQHTRDTQFIAKYLHRK